MKKILAMILVMAMSLTILSGCVKESSDTSGKSGNNDTTTPTQSADNKEDDKTEQKVDKVYIGMANPLTGANADAGMQDLAAVELAVKHINEKGGIKALGGAQVEMVVIDTTSDSTQVAQIVEREISSKKLSGIVGTGISGLTLPMLPIIEKYGIPTITNSINDAITSSDYTFIFEPVPKGSTFGQTQVDYIKYLIDEEGLDVKKVAIVYENSSYGQSTAEGSMKIAESAGLEVVLYEPFTPNFSDASSLVTAMKESGAELIMPVAYSQDAKLIVNTMKSMDYAPIIVGGGAGFLWPQLGTELGASSNGLTSVASWNWDSANISNNPELLEITKEFEATYGYFMTEHAGPSYAATWIIKEAIEKAASADPKAVRDAIASTTYDSGEPSMMQPGVIKWDQGGWNENVTAVMIQWQDGYPRTIFPRELSVTDILVPGVDY